MKNTLTYCKYSYIIHVDVKIIVPTIMISIMGAMKAQLAPLVSDIQQLHNTNSLKMYTL